MFEKLFGEIPRIEIYAIISLFTFFILYIVIVLRTIRTNKEIISKMKNLPLEPDKLPKKPGE